MTKYDRAVDLTEEELADMTTPTLGAVAQALGTSGKSYDGREKLLARIRVQQAEGRRDRFARSIYGLTNENFHEAMRQWDEAVERQVK